jgi:hypothetical protein
MKPLTKKDWILILVWVVVILGVQSGLKYFYPSLSGSLITNLSILAAAIVGVLYYYKNKK